MSRKERSHNPPKSRDAIRRVCFKFLTEEGAAIDARMQAAMPLDEALAGASPLLEQAAVALQGVPNHEALASRLRDQANRNWPRDPGKDALADCVGGLLLAARALSSSPAQASLALSSQLLHRAGVVLASVPDSTATAIVRQFRETEGQESRATPREVGAFINRLLGPGGGLAHLPAPRERHETARRVLNELYQERWHSERTDAAIAHADKHKEEIFDELAKIVKQLEQWERKHLHAKTGGLWVRDRIVPATMPATMAWENDARRAVRALVSLFGKTEDGDKKDVRPEEATPARSKSAGRPVRSHRMAALVLPLVALYLAEGAGANPTKDEREEVAARCKQWIVAHHADFDWFPSKDKPFASELDWKGPDCDTPAGKWLADVRRRLNSPPE